jgi:uncharacterized protein
MKMIRLISLIALVLCITTSCNTVSKDKLVKNNCGNTLQPFSLHDVRITDGMFKHAMELDKKWLLSLEPDRLLSGFRLESGLTPKAEKYGGWESAGLTGHTLGHYLSACAMMYASTGDEQLNRQIQYTITELDSCQQAFGNGLVAAFPRAKEVFEEIQRGDIRSTGFDLNECWVPMYNMHKLFAGLIDVYEYTGNKFAYEILIKLSDWMVSVFSPLSDEQLQKILDAEHGGINEALASVYDLSRQQKYLDLSLRLNHHKVLGPLANKQDKLAGLHANTQIPKVVGTIRQYEVSGDTSLFILADFFWSTVVNHHSYVIGGNSEAEHFGLHDKTYDRITGATCETCNSYNMLKLTRHLFQINQEIEKADYYERTLYNHIFASQNPEDGMVCYFSPLASGSQKGYSNPFDAFWCCVGSGLENHSRYGEFIYFSDSKDNLYVNLFIPSQLNWKKRNIEIEQITNFPESDTTSFKFEMKKNEKFKLKLRYPEWAKNGYTVLLNGKKIEVDNKSAMPGSYLSIKRKWKDGDRLLYVLPMSLSSEEALGDSTMRAYLYGPVVLAAQLTGDDIPVVLTSQLNDAEKNVSPTSEKLEFIIDSTYPAGVRLIPYYKTTNNRMMVYFKHLTPDEWKKKRDILTGKISKEQSLKNNTVDYFRLGEMQPERDHNFNGTNSKIVEIEGRKCRETTKGGSISFAMDVLPDEPMDLQCTYWGQVGADRKFSIAVDGEEFTVESVHWWGERFVDKPYKIPQNLTTGKKKVVVEFKALDEDCIVGPISEMRILKSE